MEYGVPHGSMKPESAAGAFPPLLSARPIREGIEKHCLIESCATES